jgi:hypothetical protein
VTESVEVGDRRGVHGCARCPWVAGEESAAEHAAAFGHPLCTVCGRSLPSGEGMACDGCLVRVRERLSGIVLMFDELPRHLTRVGSGGRGRGCRGGGDGRPLPGGDVLALLAPGSEGLAEDGETTRDDDPVSVAYELAWWERDWREERGELAFTRTRTTRRMVHDAAAYLERRSRWAATSHLGFDEFAEDLRRLHGRLERATGRYRSPSRVGADCFDCGGPLLREVHDGLEDLDATCQVCRVRYSPQRYTLALRLAAERASTVEIAGDTYATPAVLAHTTGRSERTLRDWARPDRGLVRRVERRGVLLLHVGDVSARHAERPLRAARSDKAS